MHGGTYSWVDMAAITTIPSASTMLTSQDNDIGTDHRIELTVIVRSILLSGFSLSRSPSFMKAFLSSFALQY